jgi:heme-degrading monooxygenase HmoA
VKGWRQHFDHRAAQKSGREGIFLDYRLRVAEVLRDYGMKIRVEAPEDSRALLG